MFDIHACDPRGFEMSECDVLVLADYFCDIVITGLPEPPRLGADMVWQGVGYQCRAGIHRDGGVAFVWG